MTLTVKLDIGAAEDVVANPVAVASNIVLGSYIKRGLSYSVRIVSAQWSDGEPEESDEEGSDPDNEEDDEEVRRQTGQHIAQVLDNFIEAALALELGPPGLSAYRKREVALARLAEAVQMVLEPRRS